jgi:hypothetical protein
MENSCSIWDWLISNWQTLGLYSGCSQFSWDDGTKTWSYMLSSYNLLVVSISVPDCRFWKFVSNSSIFPNPGSMRAKFSNVLEDASSLILSTIVTQVSWTSSHEHHMCIQPWTKSMYSPSNGWSYLAFWWIVLVIIQAKALYQTPTN